MNKPVLGILGGVGPLATAYFMELIINKTPARRDQDHIPMIVYNDPQIPDRTAYILDKSRENPCPEMVKVAGWLERAGADFIAIPCNTAHYFYDAINEAVAVPVLNIMEETAHAVMKAVGQGATIGLLATEGTVSSGVFQSFFEKSGLTTLTPDPKNQQKLMELIYDGVKTSHPYNPQDFCDIAERLHNAGCAAVVVGCTELSVIYQDLADKPPYLVDSLDVLAQTCVRYYADHQ